MADEAAGLPERIDEMLASAIDEQVREQRALNEILAAVKEGVTATAALADSLKDELRAAREEAASRADALGREVSAAISQISVRLDTLETAVGELLAAEPAEALRSSVAQLRERIESMEGHLKGLPTLEVVEGALVAAAEAIGERFDDLAGQVTETANRIDAAGARIPDTLAESVGRIPDALSESDARMRDALTDAARAIGERLGDTDRALAERLDAADGSLAERLGALEGSVGARLDGAVGSSAEFLRATLDALNGAVADLKHSQEAAISEQRAAVDRALAERFDTADRSMAERLRSLEDSIGARLDVAVGSSNESLRATLDAWNGAVADLKRSEETVIDEARAIVAGAVVDLRTGNDGLARSVEAASEANLRQAEERISAGVRAVERAIFDRLAEARLAQGQEVAAAREEIVAAALHAVSRVDRLEKAMIAYLHGRDYVIEHERAEEFVALLEELIAGASSKERDRLVDRLRRSVRERRDRRDAERFRAEAAIAPDVTVEALEEAAGAVAAVRAKAPTAKAPTAKAAPAEAPPAPLREPAPDRLSVPMPSAPKVDSRAPEPPKPRASRPRVPQAPRAAGRKPSGASGKTVARRPAPKAALKPAKPRPRARAEGAPRMEQRPERDVPGSPEQR